jgi:simple sugar transport system ATP-binding protein
MEAKKQKAGIILISEDLDEVLSLSDWVAPIYEGEFMGIIAGEETKRDRVGAMMAGSRSPLFPPQVGEDEGGKET